MTETCPDCGKTYLAASAVGCPYCKKNETTESAPKEPPSLAESWEMIDEGWEDVDDDIPPPPPDEPDELQERADADKDPPQHEQPAFNGGGAKPDAGIVAIARNEDSVRGAKSEPKLRKPGLSTPKNAVVVAPAKEPARPKRTRAKGKKKAQQQQPAPQKAPKKKPPRIVQPVSEETSKPKPKTHRPWLLPSAVGIIALIALILFFIARKG